MTWEMPVEVPAEEERLAAYAEWCEENPGACVLCNPHCVRRLLPDLRIGQTSLQDRQDPLLIIPSLFVPKVDDWLNSNMRLHRMVKANRVKAWREAAAREVPADWAPFAGPVRIVAEIVKDRGGRYDPNNLNTTTKACVDGFVDAGLFVDDDWNHVIGPDHRHGGKGEPGILFYFHRVTLSCCTSTVTRSNISRMVPVMSGGV